MDGVALLSVIRSLSNSRGSLKCTTCCMKSFFIISKGYKSSFDGDDVYIQVQAVTRKGTNYHSTGFCSVLIPLNKGGKLCSPIKIMNSLRVFQSPSQRCLVFSFPLSTINEKTWAAGAFFIFKAAESEKETSLFHYNTLAYPPTHTGNG